MVNTAHVADWPQEAIALAAANDRLLKRHAVEIGRLQHENAALGASLASVSAELAHAQKTAARQRTVISSINVEASTAQREVPPPLSPPPPPHPLRLTYPVVCRQTMRQKERAEAAEARIEALTASVRTLQEHERLKAKDTRRRLTLYNPV